MLGINSLRYLITCVIRQFKLQVNNLKNIIQMNFGLVGIRSNRLNKIDNTIAFHSEIFSFNSLTQIAA